MKNFTRSVSSCIVMCSNMRKQAFFFVILLLICNPLKETFYSFKKRKHTLLSYAIAAARRFKCDLGLFVELLEFSEDRSPWESAEEKLTAIR